jgi:hypothetical protein
MTVDLRARLVLQLLIDGSDHVEVTQGRKARGR